MPFIILVTIFLFSLQDRSLVFSYFVGVTQLNPCSAGQDQLFYLSVLWCFVLAPDGELHVMHSQMEVRKKVQIWELQLHPVRVVKCQSGLVQHHYV